MLFLWGYIHKLGAISIFSINVWAMLGILLSTPLNISGVFYSYLTVHQGQLTINFDQIVVANEVLILFQVNTEKNEKTFFWLCNFYTLWDIKKQIQHLALMIAHILTTVRMFGYSVICLSFFSLHLHYFGKNSSLWHNVTSWIFRFSFSYQKLKNLNTSNNDLFLLRVKHRPLLFSCF